jgi:uncharacterized protein (TIGR02646 family)
VRTITKGAEPPSLTAHRQTAHCDYDNYSDKAALRVALAAEQRGICCYCMRRIRPEPAAMKIEHWRCQRHHQAEQLNYRNLLGACLGGHGQPSRLQHCDTRKADSDLRWNPAEPAHHIETRLRYEMDGSIRSDEPDFDVQLKDVLNVNIDVLKNNRKAVWVAITEWWTAEKARLRGPVPRALIERERDRRVAGNGELSPFCQVAVWWLDQRLARMRA